MSADNFLSIHKEKDGTFKSYMGCASNGFVGGKCLFEAKDTEDAIKKAQKYMSENVVEYGFQFPNL